ncbi:MAG: ATP-binding protein [Deltaproteobacteria bacterium]|nr:ATP-binding protein [Deltaproteobacteria bacterium]
MMMHCDPSLLDAACPWIVAQLRSTLEPADVDAALGAQQLRDDFHAVAAEAEPMRMLGRLGLSQSELALLVTLAVVEVDAGAATLLRALGDDVLGGLRRFIYGGRCSARSSEELGARGNLRRLGLVDFEQMRQLGAPRVRVSPRVIDLLQGVDVPHPLTSVRAARSTHELAIGSATLADAVRAVGAGRPVTVVASGPSGSGRGSLLIGAARNAGLAVLDVDCRSLSREVGVLVRELRAIALECKLQGRAPLLANLDALVDETAARMNLVGSELAPQIEGLILASSGTRCPTIRWSRPTVVIEMEQPTTGQRAALWHSSLGQGTGDDAQLLAERYPLAPALIVRASEAAKARANGRDLQPDDIYAGIRSVLDDRLGQFAKRVTVTQTWDDLVLPPDQLDTIVELMARVRGRTKVYEQWGFAAKVGKGLGVSALFSGPPGTGKTMVAALIARDLGLELYQVDLGKIVSKFIGETEKNLGALFDAAEAGHAILLFDEADALFGKRTDVKSSNDRYANLETNYLLQRLESFTGICLLTTNHESHIDPAFQRRLSLHLRFELPDVDERAQLWRATLPIAAPLAGNVDFCSLARRYAMSGGYIRNAALRAAFLAADEDSEITAAHLERAARVEYEGMGKIAA